MRISIFLRRAVLSMLGVFGAVVLVALALDRGGAPAPSPQRVKLHVDVLCDIEFQLDPRVWEQEAHQLQTWRLLRGEGQPVWLHVFLQRGSERAVPADCRQEPIGNESMPTGVPVTYQAGQCTGRATNAWGKPSAPHRLSANLEARFVTLRLVAAGSDRSSVLAQQDALRAVVRSLRLDACRDLTWAP